MNTIELLVSDRIEFKKIFYLKNYHYVGGNAFDRNGVIAVDKTDEITITLFVIQVKCTSLC